MQLLDITYTLEAIDDAIAAIMPLIASHKIVGLIGEMGAGKTTLVSALGRQLAIVDEVSSPTFAIINEYRNNSQESIFHLDLYRIAAAEELMEIGLEELLEQPYRLMLIEWPQIALPLLPEDTLILNLQKVSAKKRRLTATLLKNVRF